MDIKELKKKLRKLKRQEQHVRFPDRQYNKSISLIWNQFFSTKDPCDNKVQFNLEKLVRMEHVERKEVFSAFFYSVYYQYYKENGLSYKNMYDPSLLAAFGLPANAGLDDIKERFRVLAKKYHPDNGGDAQDFIKVIEAYEQIRSND